MRIIDLIQVIKAVVAYTYYPNAFPATSVDDCAVVKILAGSDATVQVERPGFQVIVRARKPSDAEAKAYEIYDQFKVKGNFDVGTAHVIFCNAQQSAPLFVGADENGRFLYSINFNTITEVL